MFSMFRMFFSAMTMFFSAFQKAASSLNTLASIGDEMASSYAEESRVERAAKLKALKAEIKATGTVANP